MDRIIWDIQLSTLFLLLFVCINIYKNKKKTNEIPGCAQSRANTTEGQHKSNAQTARRLKMQLWGFIGNSETQADENNNISYV